MLEEVVPIYIQIFLSSFWMCFENKVARKQTAISQVKVEYI